MSRGCARVAAGSRYCSGRMELNLRPSVRDTDARAATLHARTTMIGSVRLFLAHPTFILVERWRHTPPIRGARPRVTAERVS